MDRISITEFIEEFTIVLSLNEKNFAGFLSNILHFFIFYGGIVATRKREGQMPPSMEWLKAATEENPIARQEPSIKSSLPTFF